MQCACYCPRSLVVSISLHSFPLSFPLHSLSSPTVNSSFPLTITHKHTQKMNKEQHQTPTMRTPMSVDDASALPSEVPLVSSSLLGASTSSSSSSASSLLASRDQSSESTPASATNNAHQHTITHSNNAMQPAAVLSTTHAASVPMDSSSESASASSPIHVPVASSNM